MTKAAEERQRREANMARWDRLSKTDPNATQKFKRTGFSGTAINPLYLIRRMTEEFGPAGVGWGMKSVDFQTVFPQDVDPLVYATVTIWVESPDNTIIGVGGDTLITTFKSGGSVADDEAFKKAYTDACGNAFKQLGMGADIYMGLFDDNKYVQQRIEEVAAQNNPHTRTIDDCMDAMQKAKTLEKLASAIKLVGAIRDELKAHYPGQYASIINYYKQRENELKGETK